MCFDLFYANERTEQNAAISCTATVSIGGWKKNFINHAQNVAVTYSRISIAIA